MRYVSFTITTHQNRDCSKLAAGTTCGQCQQPIAEGQSYTVHSVRTATMSGHSFHYYHWDHAPKKGSGWGDFQPGESISSPSQVKAGDLLLQYSPQFDAYNVVRVTQTRWQGEPDNLVGQRFYGVFVDPADPSKPRLFCNGEFCVWCHDIGHTHILHRAIRSACSQ